MWWLGVLNSLSVSAPPFLLDWGNVTVDVTAYQCDPDRPLYNDYGLPNPVSFTVPSANATLVDASIWQMQFRLLGSTLKASPNGPIYLWLNVSDGYSTSFKNVQVYVCDKIVPSKTPLSPLNQLVRRCGTSNRLEYKVDCSDTYPASQLICSGTGPSCTAAPQVGGNVSCSDVCNPCTGAIRNVSMDTLPPSASPTQTPTSSPTPGPVSPPAISFGYPTLDACYKVPDTDATTQCEPEAFTGGWCSKGTFWTVSNYTMTDPRIAPWRPNASTSIGANLTAKLRSPLDLTPLTNASASSLCVCTENRQAGWSRSLVSAWIAGTPTAAPVPSNAPTATPTAPAAAPTPVIGPWSDSNFTVRNFWPAHDSNVEYVWGYTINGPYLVIGPSKHILENPEARTHGGVMRPNESVCEATEGCRSVKPLGLSLPDTGNKFSCLWGCVNMINLDQTEAPLGIQILRRDNISRCSSTFYFYMNLQIVSVFYQSLQFLEAQAAADLNDPGSVALWTPWVNMTNEWLSANNYLPSQCSGDMASGCIPVLKWYPNYTAWLESLDPATVAFVGNLSDPVLINGGSRLYPDFWISDEPAVYSPLPHDIFLRRQCLYTLYQAEAVGSSRYGGISCDRYNDHICEMDALHAATLTMNVTIYSSVDVDPCYNSTTVCTSSYGGHASQCNLIRDAAMCEATPLCYACTRVPTPQPTPFVPIKTLPPTAKPPAAPSVVNMTPIVVTVAIGFGVVLLLVIIAAVLSCRRASTQGDPEETMSLLSR